MHISRHVCKYEYLYYQIYYVHIFTNNFLPTYSRRAGPFRLCLTARTTGWCALSDPALSTTPLLPSSMVWGRYLYRFSIELLKQATGRFCNAYMPLCLELLVVWIKSGRLLDVSTVGQIPCVET